MLNQIVLVGRLVSDPEIKETENGNKVSTITLAVPRSYKNVNGEYDTDFIPVKLFKAVAGATTEYCKKGDIVGVKGRVARLSGKDLEIVAEKVTFLSSRKENE
jgi:single-strand DNA-binding protein